MIVVHYWGLETRETVSSGEEFVHLHGTASYWWIALKHLAAHDERKWKQKVDDQREDTVYDACRGVLLLSAYIIYLSYLGIVLIGHCGVLISGGERG